MHPFIKKYITSSLFLYEEWPNYLSKDNLLEATILNLNETLNKFEATAKLNEDDIDSALNYGHEDADIFIFFISLSILILSQQTHLEKAKSLVSIGNNTITSNLQPAVQAFFLQVCSRLKFYCGDLIEEKELLAKSLSLLQKDNPRYQSNLTNYSYMLARSGMLNDLDAIDKELFYAAPKNNQEKGSLNNEIIVANCIMQGDVEKGFEHLKYFLESNRNVKSSRYENALFSLNILAGNRDLSLYINAEFRDVALVFEEFYENRWEVVAEKISIIKKIEFTNPFIHFITRYLPLHLELYEKNIGKAKIILKENLKSGKAHFLDDLFNARISLLENKKNEALFYIKRLTFNVRKYGFERRMIFELQFVKEISASDLYFLLQKADEFKDKNIPLEDDFEKELKVNHKGLDLIVGQSAILSKAKKLIQKFSEILEPVLVTGETGTGKELVAQALHDIGANSQAPFLAINCGALTDTLLQSELFGYEAGSFTGALKEKKGIFEAAGKGTVFLDEFEDVSAKMQSSLLRVLETNEIRLIGGAKTRKIHCKIVVATNVSLKELVRKKSFREDLYFRLSRFEIKLPALRERKEDIPELIQHFLLQQNQKEFVPEIGKELLEKLMDYNWPGNIRELRNAVERMKVLHSNKKVFGLEEFEFDQLESYTISNTSTKKESMAVVPKVVNLESEEDTRVKKIIDKGFKIESRKEYLKEIFIKYKKLSRSQVVEILKVSPLTAANTLQSLCELGFIIKKMPSKSSKSHYYEWKN